MYDDDDYDEDNMQLTSDPADGTMGDLMRSMAAGEAQEAREEREAFAKGQKVNDALNKIMKHLDVKLTSYKNAIIELEVNDQGIIYGFTIKENNLLSYHCDHKNNGISRGLF